MPRHKPHGVSLLVLRLPARPHFRLLPTTQDYQLGQGHGGRHLSTVRNVLPGHREETCFGAWLLCSTHLPQRSKASPPAALSIFPVFLSILDETKPPFSPCPRTAVHTGQIPEHSSEQPSGVPCCDLPECACAHVHMHTHAHGNSDLASKELC